MMNYEKKYNDLTSVWNLIPDVSQDYPDCNGFEKCVISMRKQGWTYAQIQSKLGMPPKKQIRAALLKWAPELIDNSKTKIINISTPESELYNIIKSHNNEIFDVWGEKWTLFIENNKLFYTDKTGIWEFSDWDENTQSQILDEIKNQLNER